MQDKILEKVDSTNLVEHVKHVHLSKYDDDVSE